MKVLITGGAGFIGSHLSKRLIAEGCSVTILDNFSEQIHGINASLSEDLCSKSIKLIIGDVRNKSIVAKAISDAEVIVHLAAETGTGQSMYEIEKYCSCFIEGNIW